jgi:hypothetical protein
MRVLQFFGGGIFVADPTTYDPLEILLNTEDEDERNELTKRWRDNKLSELSFVGVVVCTGSFYLVSRDVVCSYPSRDMTTCTPKDVSIYNANHM